MRAEPVEAPPSWMRAGFGMGLSLSKPPSWITSNVAPHKAAVRIGWRLIVVRSSAQGQFNRRVAAGSSNCDF